MERAGFGPLFSRFGYDFFVRAALTRQPQRHTQLQHGVGALCAVAM